jgi:cytochrome oxidase assembly protein ShyY1
MFKNLTRPRWIALTVVLLGLIYLFIRLSDWQFDRYDQRIIRNEQATSALSSAPKNIVSSSQLSEMKQWEKVEMTGTYLNEQSKLVRKQYLENSLGFWIITPFQIQNGDHILINRGWIPIGSSASTSQSIPMAPAGRINIEGYLQPFDSSTIQPKDLPINQVNTIDYKYFDFDIANDYYLQLAKSSPMDNQVAIIPLPELSNGPHLSYAIQWILFALLLPIGWYVLLKNESK